MIRCLLAVSAESVIRDAETNMVSAVNIFDEINSQSFPLLMPKLSCLFLFGREEDDAGESDATVSFTHPNGQLFQTLLPLDFQGKLRLRSMVVLQGFVIPAPGWIRIVVKHGEDVLAVWEMPVVAIGGPQLKLPIESASAAGQRKEEPSHG